MAQALALAHAAAAAGEVPVGAVVVKDGVVVFSAQGSPIKNPAYTVANETMRQMVTFGSLLGLDPSSRTRLIGGNKATSTNEFAKLLST